MKKIIYTCLLASLLVMSCNRESKEPKPLTGPYVKTFWKVSGNGLKEPSYLFGTHHLLGIQFLDSLHHVKEKFNECKTVVGEMIMDGEAQLAVAKAAILKGKTLKDLLGPSLYDSTEKMMKDLSGKGLEMYNGMSPMMVEVMLTFFAYQKVYPDADVFSEEKMDLYFQRMAGESNKKLVGLETPADQVAALFGQFPEERQVELLRETVKRQNEMASQLQSLNEAYRSGDLAKMIPLMYDYNYTQEEIDVLLGNRNRNWMKQLPQLMKESSVFVGVGAMHLAGDDGLVNLLRKEGYTLDSLQLK